MVNIRKSAKDFKLVKKNTCFWTISKKTQVLIDSLQNFVILFKKYMYVAIPLKDCLNDTYQCGKMSVSQKRAVISMLPK